MSNTLSIVVLLSMAYPFYGFLPWLECGNPKDTPLYSTALVFCLDPFLVKPDGSCVLLVPCWYRQWSVQLGTTGLDPALTGAHLKQRRVQVGHDHVIASLPGFGQDAPVRVKDHRVACANFVVVHPDAIAVDQENAVVVRAGRQPAHQPAPALGAAQFGLDGGGVCVAVLPQRRVDQPHRVRVGRVAAAGLVGGEEDLCALERGDSNVLTDVGVIYPNCYTPWRLTWRVDSCCCLWRCLGLFSC
jgi:hypothetical protein